MNPQLKEAAIATITCNGALAMASYFEAKPFVPILALLSLVLAVILGCEALRALSE